MDYQSVAKFLSIPTAFLLCGYGFGFSQNSVPLLYSHPASVSAPLLEGVYYQGAKVVPAGAVLAGTAYGYLAYTARTPEERNLYASAAGLAIASQPWTALVMVKGIYRLIEIGRNSAEAAKADQSGEAVELLKGWVWQNMVRAALALGSGMIGLYTQMRHG